MVLVGDTFTSKAGHISRQDAKKSSRQLYMTYLKHRITNATAEGFNSKIQAVKSATRRFRNFENYRVSILFHCGKLNLYP